MRHSTDRSPSIFRLGLLVVLAVTSLSAQQPVAGASAGTAAETVSRRSAAAIQNRRELRPGRRLSDERRQARGGPARRGLRAARERGEAAGAGVRARRDQSGGPQSMRVEANTVRGGEQMASNPRNRVFVIFLDIPHVDIASGHHINQPLVRLIDASWARTISSR